MRASRSHDHWFPQIPFLLIFAWFTACRSQPIQSPSASDSPTSSSASIQTRPPSQTPAVNSGQVPPTAAETTVEPEIDIPSATLEPGPPQEVTPAQIELIARYDHASRDLDVSQRINYTNLTGQSLPDFVLLVEPNRYPSAFNLLRLAWDDGSPVEGYSLSGNRLNIPLPQPLQPGNTLALDIAYSLALPPIPEDSEEYKPVPFGYTFRQVNLVDWYLFPPPYRAGAGWLVHDPWFFGEHQVYDVADYSVEFTASGSSEPLVLAASSPPESQEGDTYRYRLERARSFVLSISPYYQVYTQQVGETTVLSYGLPYFEEGAQAVLQYTAEALEVYNALFGAYPRSNLSVVVADFLDGMEYDGLYFLSRGFYNIYDGTPASYLTIIAVHETAHQWWYGRVGNDQALEPWLDEALCTYTERLYYEQVHPELVDWWWDYRVNFYQPSGMVDGTIYDYAGFRPYRDAVYLQGARFLEALRQRVGDDVFFAFIKDYADRMAGKQATSEDFFTLLDEYTGEDLSDLMQLYFSP